MKFKVGNKIKFLGSKTHIGEITSIIDDEYEIELLESEYVPLEVGNKVLAKIAYIDIGSYILSN